MKQSKQGQGGGGGALHTLQNNVDLTVPPWDTGNVMAVLNNVD
jgi:hypothetical protein